MENLSNFVLYIFSFFLNLLIFTICLNLGKVKKRRWKKIPGKENYILIKKGYEKMKLPKIQGRQIKSGEIKKVGINKNGEYIFCLRRVA